MRDDYDYMMIIIIYCTFYANRTKHWERWFKKVI